MGRAEDSFQGHLLDGKSLEAANDAVTGGGQPSRGWDPFEVWRTRVRAKRRQRTGEGKGSRD